MSFFFFRNGSFGFKSAPVLLLYNIQKNKSATNQSTHQPTTEEKLTMKKTLKDRCLEAIAHSKIHMPVVGQGIQYRSGSDRYGHQIAIVSDNLDYIFDDELECYKLQLNKNSRAYGQYIRCFFSPKGDFASACASDPENWVIRRPWSSCGWRYYNDVYLNGKQGMPETYLDPSF